MLQELMTVMEFRKFEERTLAKVNGPHNNPGEYIWFLPERLYLSTIANIGCVFKIRMDFRPDGSIWAKRYTTDHFCTEDITAFHHLPGDYTADGEPVFEGSYMRLARRPDLLINKAMNKVGCRLHDTQLDETARMLEEENIRNVSFPKYYMFRSFLLADMNDFKASFNFPDLYAPHCDLKGVKIPEIRPADDPLRTEYARRSRSRFIYRLKATEPDFWNAKLSDRIIHDIETRTNPLWWIAASRELDAIQRLQMRGILAEKPQLYAMPYV